MKKTDICFLKTTPLFYPSSFLWEESQLAPFRRIKKAFVIVGGTLTL